MKYFMILSVLVFSVAACSEVKKEHIPEEELDKLVKDLKNPDVDISANASAKLSKAPDQSIPVLAEILYNDPVPENRRRAVFALKYTRDKRAVEPLIRGLDDPMPEVGIFAAHSLGALGDERAVKPLINKLAGENAFMKQWAYGALKDITGEDFGTDYNKWKHWYDKNK